MDNFYILQPTDQTCNESLQKHKHTNSLQNHKHDTTAIKHRKINLTNPNGIYRLQCITCNRVYIGQQQLNIGKVNLTNPNGIYRLHCMTCNRVYIGQMGSSISTIYKEPITYVKYNNPQSTYAMHILNNRHKLGLETEILKLLKHCTKGSKMNVWENLFLQEHHIR